MGPSRRTLAVLAIGAALACAGPRHAGRPPPGVGPRVANLSASVAARSPRLVIASAEDGVPRLLAGQLDDGAAPEPLAAFPGPLALDFGRRRVVTADGAHLVFQCEDHAF